MIKKIRRKKLLIKRNLSEEKNPPLAQIFRYFRIESRINKLRSKTSNFVESINI